jgi:pimeloyl-ACP methyl ester carboxylesterase
LPARLNGHVELSRNLLRLFRYSVAAEIVVAVILSGAGLVLERRAQQRDGLLYKPPGQLIDIGGYRLHLSCTGSGGPTVVLEHGHRATFLDWYRVQPEIAKFTRVCSYDRPGHGWSDPSPKPRVPSVMADELHALMHDAGEKPPYLLVAHSFGSLNAVMFAHKFPQEVAGLVLADGSHHASLGRLRLRQTVWLRIMQFTMPFGLPRWRGWCGGGPGEIAGVKEAVTCRWQYPETIFRESSAFPQAAAEMRSVSSVGDVPLVVIARDPASGHNPAAEEQHHKQQRDSTKLSTNSRFVIAEGSAHDIPLARPDVIVSAVKSLLRVQAPAGSRGTP